jgi:hypothetical protein
MWRCGLMMIEVPYKNTYIPVGKVTLKKDGKLNLRGFPFGSYTIVVNDSDKYYLTVLSISDCDTFVFYMFVISEAKSKTPKFYILRLSKESVLKQRVEYIIRDTPQDASFVYIKEMESCSGERIDYAKILKEFKGTENQILYS